MLTSQSLNRQSALRGWGSQSQRTTERRQVSEDTAAVTTLVTERRCPARYRDT